MTAALSSEADSEIDISNWGSRYALDVIGLAGFGKDFGAIKNESNSLVKAFHSMFHVTKQKRVLFFLGSLLPWKLVRKLPLKHNKEFSGAIQTIRRSCQTIIEEKRAISTGRSIQDTDFLSIAMGNGLFSDEGLIDQVMTFLAAGHETTASVLTWAIYVLALNPKIQQQLRDEIRNNLEPLHAGSDYSSESISRLPFLYAVCNEVLRMFTPVRLTMREATRDTFLQDIAIPRGTKIMISSCATNMDKSLWGPDATEFNPHRWLNVDSEGKLKVNSGGGAGSNYAMLTFLQGHRICVGQGFARAEFACMLAGWVGRFEFVMKNEDMADMNKIKIASGITVKPANGMRVSVRPVSGY
ncbi:hypothetical protein N7541_006519 [Penicillium brevicompactum]|uniref:Cytochrome P450 n=1 Tax=Penicillium brevicompactum TaxID=5074 RepID=A0A9W9R6S7_PENBR|nr:hypothetical protein N7541_006519 [Penicillium brevicompactum]